MLIVTGPCHLRDQPRYQSMKDKRTFRFNRGLILIGLIMSLAGLPLKTTAKLMTRNQAITAPTSDGIHREAELARLIEQTQQQEGRFTPLLYGLLDELGRAQQNRGDHRAALDSFVYMQTLTHWRDGVNTPLQMDSLRLMSHSYLALGKFKRADVVERLHLRVALLNNEDDTSQWVRPLWRMADWQRSSQQYTRALKNYDKALEVITDNHMPYDFLVRTLRAKALTQHLANKCCATELLAELANLSARSPTADNFDKRRSRLEVADLLMLEGQPEAAASQYKFVHHAPASVIGIKDRASVMKLFNDLHNPLTSNLEVETIRPIARAISLDTHEKESKASSLGYPIRLCSTGLDKYVDKKADTDIFADVRIDVSAKGRAEQIDITGNASLKLKRYLRYTLRESRYRPDIDAEGNLQAASISFRQYFDRTAPLEVQEVPDWSGILIEHACQNLASNQTI